MKLNGVKVTWLGHEIFLIETTSGKKIIIDPWVAKNPKTPAGHKSFDRLDAILCTHGHGDHSGDLVELAQKHGATVVGIFELCSWPGKKGGKQIAPMNKGGTPKGGAILFTI